jgi:membrane-associated phospholipid phosphatase
MDISRLLASLRSSFDTISPRVRENLLRYFILYALPVIAITGFFGVGSEVREGDTLPIDESILLSVRSLQTPVLDVTMRVITEASGPIALPALVLIVSAYLLATRRRYEGLLIGLGVGGAALINTLLKLIYQRDRPALWERVVVEHSPSFPSGHAMGSSALAFVVILLAWRTRWRYHAIAGAIAFMVLVGFSRLYFGVHYPSDVLAGWLVSFGWVFGVYSILRRSRKRPASQ